MARRRLERWIADGGDEAGTTGEGDDTCYDAEDVARWRRGVLCAELEPEAAVVEESAMLDEVQRIARKSENNQVLSDAEMTTLRRYRASEIARLEAQLGGAGLSGEDSAELARLRKAERNDAAEDARLAALAARVEDFNKRLHGGDYVGPREKFMLWKVRHGLLKWAWPHVATVDGAFPCLSPTKALEQIVLKHLN